MQTFNRRDFLKGTGTLALAAAASGLLCGAAEVPTEAEPDTALCTIGGLRVLDVRARVCKYPSDDYPYDLEVYFDLENTNDFTAYFHQENYIVSVGGKRYDTRNYFTGLNKWNGSHYIQDIWLKPGEASTITYSCRLDKAGTKVAFQDGMQITFQYRQQRQTFVSSPLTQTSSACALDGSVQSTAFPTVGGVQLSALWCNDSSTQNGFYSLRFYFTLQNKSDTEIALPFRGVSEGDVQDNFSVELDGQRKEHYRLHVYTHDNGFRPQEGGHLESLQPGESQFAKNSISLTKEEYDTLYNGGHTVTFTFTCGDEKLTLRGDPAIGIFEAV